MIQLNISASLSEASRGENLAPLFEMHKAGAIAFGDFNLPPWYAGVAFCN